jgi:fatty acid desaturase
MRRQGACFYQVANQEGKVSEVKHFLNAALSVALGFGFFAFIGWGYAMCFTRPAIGIPMIVIPLFVATTFSVYSHEKQERRKPEGKEGEVKW